MKKTIIFFIAMQLNIMAIFAQNYPLATKASERQKGYLKKLKLEQNSLLNALSFRSIGPSVMSGRVTDIDINENTPNQFYVAYASGGLWKTENQGLSFKPIYDYEAVMTIGDIAIDWQHGETIWVGSGEVNSSRSSYAGNGVYKSSDQGKSWQHLGLSETHHIGRIIIHPDKANTVWIAALGHLYSTNPERGVFKTTDGGKTWKKTLFVNDSTGAVDLAIDPNNPDILYAAMWQRKRKAWNFKGNGHGSGIYKSIDGGVTWTKISVGESGFPDGEYIGRIGLSVSPQNTQIIYALLDNQNPRKEKKKENKHKLTKNQLRNISKEEFLSLNDKLINDFLKENDFPEKHNAKNIKEQIKNGRLKPVALVEYLEDANADLFESPPVGAELYRSDDGGKTWKKTHKDYLDDVFYTYGYYFAQVRVSPWNTDEVYVLGVPILKSEDGGRTFYSLQAENVHADHHALWISSKNKALLINGNDGGINISYDDGVHWRKANSPNVGQFYSVNYDMAKPYHVYGGLQDNGVWRGPSTHRENPGWQQSGHYAFKSIMGGDGMQVQIDTRDNETIYTGYQFGHYYKINEKTHEYKYFHPKHELGERPLRWNWQTPILLSKHNQDIIYMGSNKFHRSMDKAESFETLSGDLTKGGKKGNVSYGTLSTIDESPLRFGLIYIGTDDGLIYRSDDGGYTWEKLSDDLVQDLWVSRVTASKHKLSRVYTSLNGYRWDDFKAYLYVSEDFGKTWKQIGLDLPDEPINVIKEDPENEQILYVGTDNGLYVSLDKGKTFMTLDKTLARVAIHDLAIHPREHELIIGTHGRSIYIVNVYALQQLTKENLQKQLIVFKPKTIRSSSSWGQTNWWKSSPSAYETFRFTIFSKDKINAKVRITNSENLILKEFSTWFDKGLNLLPYDLTVDRKNIKKYQSWLNKQSKKEEQTIELKVADNGNYYLRKGVYKIEIDAGGKVFSNSFELK